MKKLLLYPILIYRRYLSSLKPYPCCRFKPTCSAYAYKAINEWGVIGLIPAVLRLLRCNPLFKGGEDPIPHKRRKMIPATERFGVCGLKERQKKPNNFFFIYECEIFEEP